ncbi:peptide MFS transporter [Brevibacterium moorei]|jgi:POT family proton-dependent oligopeptide transporter|uniref:peptide MFS transporter n=1 Tax=Brevibacterium moorei TaxID=2968457 RepID=UPI00211CFC72|nr:oligopeptide:H+ symporter [Brevibacterium sp. 68QC2CO]MCQ9386101.1 oligopeptide:H+ symporter [Brevibacterium sp. 68QC2CO]
MSNAKSNAADSANAPAADPGRLQERTPKGIYTLAGTEMWERFSFYGLEVILAYYIYYTAGQGGLGLPDSVALGIAGAYGGAVYLFQPVGAWLADRLIPARTLVLIGGIVIMAGHLSLALLPGLGGLLTGLLLIVLGTGALFPNLNAMVGELYDRHSRKRDFGYSLYYSGVLIGALFGPIVTGFLQVHMGFHWGFSAAALGMLFGLLLYVAGGKHLPASSRRVPNPVTRAGRSRAVAVAACILVVITVLVATRVVTIDNADLWVMGIVSAVVLVYFFVLFRSTKTTAAERRSLVAFVPVFIAGVVFWAMILQLFTTFAVYADTRVNLAFGAISIPAPYISTFEVVAGIIVGPLLGRIGARPRGPKIHDGTKLGIGMGLMTVTFAWFAVLGLGSGQVSLLPVVVGMIIMGITEVSFAPIGMSAASQLAPKAYTAQTMALWGLALALGSSLSGFMGQLYSAMNEVGFFWLNAGAALLCSVALLLLAPRLTKLGLD